MSARTGAPFRGRPSTRRRLRADIALGPVLLLGLALCFAVGPALWPKSPYATTLLAIYHEPGTAFGQWHPFGTDQLGRDMLARLLLGGRISVAIVLLSGVLAASVGSLLGTISGYFGGLVDAAIMRLADIQLAIPLILSILLVIAILGPGMQNLVLVLGLSGWATYARAARARVLELRELDFLQAARAIGASPGRILRVHLLPNLVPTQVVLMSLDLPRLVVAEASIGFLGMGIQPPEPTLGNLLADGQTAILYAPWMIVFPGLAVCMLVIGFNMTGDWIARRFGA
ncbi:ABC transporter permease [Acetobacteraceae bacterium KSS8]|uniref:ABC transporter permease n=1 Tax=Endosaccharibacter trunci TaxID=2812733 RepID=A0ABT1W6M9_9PROT|nr:ABC transporter permease [Acetobacteraceae bacterium KSS8]